MATQIEDFRIHVAPYCPRAGLQLIDQAIWNAAVELSEKSLTLREDLTPIDIVTDQYDYTLTPSDSNTRIVTVISALYDTIPIHPSGEEHLDNISPSWRRYRSITYRYYLEQGTTTTIKLTWPPTADVTGGLEVRVALKPTPVPSGSGSSYTLPDELYHEHVLTIAAGALSGLLNMPKESWHNKARAKEYELKWANGLANAASEAQRSHTRRPQQVKMRPAFRGRVRRWW